MYVWQTGSFLKTPAERSSEGDCCTGGTCCAARFAPPNNRETVLIAERTTKKTNSSSMNLKMKDHIAWGGKTRPFHYFFFFVVLGGALGFLKLVETVPPSIPIICLAESANGPSGFRSR